MAEKGRTTKRRSAKTSSTKGRRPKARTEKNDLFVVGIGSSAGGLEAIRPLVSHLKHPKPLTYVIVQHMAPQYRSMMVDLVARETELPVVQVTDGMPLEPDKIFITPPNSDIEIKQSVLYLKPTSNPVGPKPSIDNFFSSLAEDQEQNAIGVILSGTGSDGSMGIRSIKAHGGFCVVQDPKTSKYNGMPLAALETNLVDVVLPPDQIGTHLAEMIQFPTRAYELMQERESGKSAQDEILALVKKRTEIDFSNYKVATVCRRIERRLVATGKRDIDDYLAYMKENPQEAEALSKDVLISVTSFFRDKVAFNQLEEAIRVFANEKSSGDEIRIWVPGCATGEEAYSIAILLAEELGARLGSFKVQIFATDIDMEALARARQGIFLESSLKEVEQELIDRHFTKHGDKFQISKNLRDIMVFARQDLIQDPAFVRLDLVSCRNVLIYFNQELQDHVFRQFQFSLNTNGYLLLGKSESLGFNAEMFIRVSAKGRLFRRKPGMPKTLLRTVLPAMPRGKSIPEAKRKRTIEEVMQAAYLKEFAPKGMIISEDGLIHQINGKISPYLDISSGRAEMNLTRILIPELRGEFWAVFTKAKKEGKSAKGISRIVSVGRKELVVSLSIHPCEQVEEYTPLFLVCFNETPLDAKAENVADANDEAAKNGAVRVTELEQELVATKEHLQTVIQELETSNEELQALNEELQASNEEMQSTNEELETSNEELQSTNEELTTVNEELSVRTTELLETNNDLENIQRNVGYSLVILDTKLRIKRYTQQAVRLFGLTPDDLGQLITSVPGPVEIKDLRKKLVEAMGMESEISEAVHAGGRAYWMRIVPYRTKENEIDGVVIVLADQTELMEARATLEKSERQLRLVTDALPIAVAFAGDDQKINLVNAVFQKWFQPNKKPAVNRKLSGVIGRKLHGVLNPLIKEVIGKNVMRGAELEVNMPKIGPRTLHAQIAPLAAKDKGKASSFILIFEDTTNLREAIKDLKTTRERYRTLAEGSLQGLVIHQEGRSIYANHDVAKIFGYAEPEEILKLDGVGALFSDAVGKGGSTRNYPFPTGHAPKKVRAMGRKRDGKNVPLLVSSQIVKWDGRLAIKTAVVDLSNE
ncbi:MAG: PAS domain-containing protein [Magnetococcales bacterium]|nr:PAS domain-containing protein [Magnetococcales bacterium]